MNDNNIKKMVQERLAKTWGWDANEPEAEMLAENVEFFAKLLVSGTRTSPEALISALVNGPDWGQKGLVEEWDHYTNLGDGGGFGLRESSRILGILRRIV